MSWSIRITILYVGFVALILTLVYMANHQKVELVSEDYYKQELAFQDQIDHSQNSTDLKEQPSVIPSVNGVEVHFPNSMNADSISGKILFLRPSDATLDKEIELHPYNSELQIADAGFKTGLYQVKMNWSDGRKKYYNEYSIYIP